MKLKLNQTRKLLQCLVSQPQEHEIKSRVDAVWQQMNKGVFAETLNSIVNKSNSTGKQERHSDKASNNWMSILGLGLKTTEANGASSDKKLAAAAAIVASRDAAATSRCPGERLRDE